MKIETTVVAEVVGTTMCCFDSLGQHIPTGAKVTVEWDDREHRCPAMECWNGAILKEVIWYLRHPNVKCCSIAISYCPFCGGKLR